jgi:hypothetical protein
LLKIIRTTILLIALVALPLMACSSGSSATTQEPTPINSNTLRIASPIPQPTATSHVALNLVVKPTPTLNRDDLATSTPTKEKAPSPTPSPPPIQDVVLDERFTTLKNRARALRKLENLNDVVFKNINSDELRVKIRESYEDEELIEKIKIDQEVYEMLGLIGTEDNLQRLLIDLLSENVIGLYDTDTKEMYVRSKDFSFSLREQTTFVHEYLHALQDQHFDLEKLGELSEKNADFDTAIAALVEGDASLTEVLYVQQYFTSDEIRKVSEIRDPSPVFDSAPLFIRQSLIFPYQSGLEFVISLFRRGNGWDLIDKAYSNLPQSTEQVLHPEKYFGKRDEPREVAANDFAVTLGPDWAMRDDDVLGELGFRLMLRSHVNIETADIAAAGWGGDRYTYFRSESGARLLVIESVWDSQRDAREFFKAYIDFVDAKSKGKWNIQHKTGPFQSGEYVKWWKAPDGHNVYLGTSRDSVVIIIAPDKNIIELVAKELSLQW